MRSMSPTRLFLTLLVLAALALSGCAAKGEPKPKPAATPTTQQPQQPPQPKPKVGILTRVLYWTNPLNLLPKKARPPVAQQPRLLGVVKMVNLEDKYVLIDAVSQNASAGDLLVCITNQRETANLRMSSLKNPPFLIADIANGTPTVGDRVFKP